MLIHGLVVVICLAQCVAILSVKETRTRQIKSLDGIWNFAIDDSIGRNKSFVEKWWLKDFDKMENVSTMPVPSSYNDIPTSKHVRDFVGWAWYQRKFLLQQIWLTRSVVLRFESVNYYCKVWVNNHLVLEHEGGHLPFEVHVEDVLNDENIITVAVNNTLTPSTIPPGRIVYPDIPQKYPPGYFHQALNFDYFNYAGIDRQVRLYSVPSMFISNIDIDTNITDDGYGVINYKIEASNISAIKSIRVQLLNKNKDVVKSLNTKSPQGLIKIFNPHLWWPYTMNTSSYGYLYELKVLLKSIADSDEVSIPVGIRTVKWTNAKFFINEKPFYFAGINKHEDSDMRGRGVDNVLIARDFRNQKWLGSNSFRTSTYPYAEEYLDNADKMGIVVIGECPAVGLIYPENFLNLAKHIRMVKDMIARDGNHPSIVGWSLANEPKANLHIAEDYFRKLFEASRKLDKSRPFTFVTKLDANEDKVLQFSDFININIYSSWYTDEGDYEVIPYQLNYYLNLYFEAFNKPVIIQEYGADTISGLHTLPSQMFTEEYQARILKENFKVFDELRNNFLIGEFVWNYADFMTSQSVRRVVGNKKGIFDRQRQPKLAAHVLRCRYHRLNNISVEDNLIC